MTGARCAGYPFKLPNVASAFLSAAMFAPTNPNKILSWVSVLDPATNNSYVAMQCIDVGDFGAAPSDCGHYQMTPTGFGNAPAYFAGSGGPAQGVIVGTQLWALNYVSGFGPDHERNNMLCFDSATGKECPDTPFPVKYPAGWTMTGSSVAWTKLIGDRIYIATPGKVSGKQTNIITCFNPYAPWGENECGGLWPVTIPNTATQGGNTFGDLFPYRPKAEVDSGVCIGGASYGVNLAGRKPSIAHCWDLDGKSIGDLNTGSFDGVRYPGISGAIHGTRWLIPGGSGVECIDMATNATCANYPALNLAPIKELSNNTYRTYTIRRESATCYWANGDGGNIWNFNPIFGTKGCGNAPIARDTFNPITLFNEEECSQNVTGWKNFRLKNVTGTFTAATIFLQRRRQADRRNDQRAHDQRHASNCRSWCQGSRQSHRPDSQVRDCLQRTRLPCFGLRLFLRRLL